MAKKKLDELFQEKFKDFEQTPDDKVWRAIEASLDKKKKRVIPFWWKLGGVAAILAITLLAINPFANTPEKNTPITDSEHNVPDSIEQYTSTKNKSINIPDTKETQVTGRDAKRDVSEGDNRHPSKNMAPEPKKNLKFSPIPKAKKESQLTSDGAERTPNPSGVAPLPGTGITNVPEETLKKDLDQKSSPLQQDSLQNSLGKELTEKVVARQEDSLNQATKNVKGSTEDTGLAHNKDRQDDNKNKDTSIEENKKKSIFDELKKQEEDAEVVENNPEKRWSAGPNIAPVYFDIFGEGSPVNSIFVSNTKSGETNLSYGLSIAYEINDRLTLRSGLHRVDYGYDTRNIVFASSLDGAVTEQLDNIDYATTAGDLVVRSNVSGNTLSVNEEANDMALDVNNGNISTARDGAMTQQFGYLEVPLELNYALIDRKIGLNLIAGLSSLFLTDNSVSLTSGNETTHVGKANNINDFNFSTNIGLGIDYDFTPKIKLNIEPIFKYQLNTFSRVDGTFNPFSVGIYSGLTFKF